MAEMDCLNNEEELVSELYSDDQVESQLESDGEIETDFENVVEVVLSYEGEETESVVVDVDNQRSTISARVKKMWFRSFDQFPEVGSESLLYCDLSTQRLYVWDSENAQYEIASSHWSEIQEINGGGA